MATLAAILFPSVYASIPVFRAIFDGTAYALHYLLWFCHEDPPYIFPRF